MSKQKNVNIKIGRSDHYFYAEIFSHFYRVALKINVLSNKETKEPPIWKAPLFNCNYNKCIIVSSKVKLKIVNQLSACKK